jgi:hypothetical protein
MKPGRVWLLEQRTRETLANCEERGARAERDADEMIMPNLDQEIGFFYDPATKQLRKRFALYPAALQIEADFFRDLQRAETGLLQQLQAERKRHW